MSNNFKQFQTVLDPLVETFVRLPHLPPTFLWLKLWKSSANPFEIKCELSEWPEYSLKIHIWQTCIASAANSAHIGPASKLIYMIYEKVSCIEQDKQIFYNDAITQIDVQISNLKLFFDDIQSYKDNFTSNAKLLMINYNGNALDSHFKSVMNTVRKVNRSLHNFKENFETIERHSEKYLDEQLDTVYMSTILVVDNISNKSCSENVIKSVSSLLADIQMSFDKTTNQFINIGIIDEKFSNGYGLITETYIGLLSCLNISIVTIQPCVDKVRSIKLNFHN